MELVGNWLMGKQKLKTFDFIIMKYIRFWFGFHYTFEADGLLSSSLSSRVNLGKFFNLGV